MSNGWSWAGSGPSEFTAFLKNAQTSLIERGEEIVVDSVTAGAMDQKRILDAERSFTKTGIERVESGRGEFAGRHDSGAMVDAIKTDVGTTPTSDGAVILGRWGWPNPEDYFLLQDDGTDRIRAAHSLADSFTKTRELFKAAVSRIAGASK